jgi:predicted MFS family arabinose efflux permease
MAYAPTTNPPIKTSAGPLAEFNATTQPGPQVWTYRSADADATVYAAGYFSNAANLGMAVGDIVIVQVTAAGVVTDTYIHTVLSINATTGAATLSSTTVPHIN